MAADEQPRDHVEPDDGVAKDPPDIEANLKSRSTWMRLLFMIVCVAIYTVTRGIVFAVVVLQFFWTLFTSKPNGKLTGFGHSLGLYTCEIIDYLTYYTDQRPFPFERDWPAGS